MKPCDRRGFLNRLLLLVPAMMVRSAGHLFAGEVADNNSTPMEQFSSAYVPGYVALHQSGELKMRAEILNDYLKNCRLCPRECEKDRLRGQTGECKADARLRISSWAPHFGEERPLVGKNGSGTVFFSHCNLLCVFCLNWEISQGGSGTLRDTISLANMMLNLQRMGCHNINLVTPSHYSPQILAALDNAAGRGLRVPLVYNTSGWEKEEILQLLDGVVDIYLADFKYFDSRKAGKYSVGANSYPEITKKALLEMHRQVGMAKVPSPGSLMNRGLMIRHLVMPNNVSNSVDVMRWISDHLPSDTYVNIMSQYTPVFRAHEYPEINRRITTREYRTVVNAAREFGLTNLDVQGSA
jgi:putative pyruvate formate lyase activating enzyme